MGEAGEVQRLEGPGVGGRDDDERAGILEAVLQPLLVLDPLDYLVRQKHLGRLGVRPRPDPDPVAADHDGAVSPIMGRKRGGRRGGGQL